MVELVSKHLFHGLEIKISSLPPDSPPQLIIYKIIPLLMLITLMASN